MSSAQHKGLLVYCVIQQRINATGKYKIGFPALFVRRTLEALQARTTSNVAPSTFEIGT